MMKYKSEFSEIEILDNEIKTKNKKNLFNNKSDFKYLDFKTEHIKEIEVKTLKLSKVILIVTTIIGLLIPISNLQKKSYTNPYVEWFESPYILIDTTFEERVSFLLLGAFVIGLGIFFSRKFKKEYDGIKAIQIKYILNNKEKSCAIYQSHDESNVIEVHSKMVKVLNKYKST